MLRRAMDLGGFHQVIFICHTPLVWELADRVGSIKDQWPRPKVAWREGCALREHNLISAGHPETPMLDQRRSPIES